MYNHILINLLKGSQKQDCYEHLSLPKLTIIQCGIFIQKDTEKS